MAWEQKSLLEQVENQASVVELAGPNVWMPDRPQELK